MQKPQLLAKYFLMLATVVALTACGGGGDDSPTNTSDLADNPIGTKGDLINKNELSALRCGMNHDQVLAIVGDTPSVNQYDALVFQGPPGTSYAVLFVNGGLNKVYAGVQQFAGSPADLSC